MAPATCRPQSPHRGRFVKVRRTLLGSGALSIRKPGLGSRVNWGIENDEITDVPNITHMHLVVTHKKFSGTELHALEYQRCGNTDPRGRRPTDLQTGHRGRR